VTGRLPWARNIDRHGTSAFQVAALAYVFFGLLDCVTTAVALARGGREGNQFAASLYSSYGLAGLFTLKAIVVALILGILVIVPRRLAAWVTTAFASGVALAVVGNLHALTRLG
jgi:hypothetical protein